MARGSAEAMARARGQLRRVLWILGGLDLTVVLFVLGVALERGRLGLTNAELFLVILIGASLVVLTRILLALRLRRRGGNLF